MIYNTSLMETILSCMAEGLLVVDHKTQKVLQYNESFLSMWKIDRSHISSKNDEDALRQAMERLKEPDKFMALVKDLYQNPEKTSHDIIELKDEVFFERRSQPFYLDKQLIGRIFFFRDITAEYLGKRNLMTQNALLETIVNSIPYSVFWKDKDLNYLGCNQRFIQDTGMDLPSRIIGKCDYDMPWSKEEADFFRKCDSEIMASGIAINNQEESQQRSTGEVTTLLTSKVPMMDGDNKVLGILGIYTDISEFKKNQELLKINESLLVAASQMSSIGEMAGGIAHEINNPLSIVKSATTYLHRQLAKDSIDKPAVELALTDIDETVERIAKIIDGLRNLSRSSDNEKGPCCYKEIMDDVLGIASERFRAHGIEIKLLASSENLSRLFVANRIQLSQVVINLLNNSFDALEALKTHSKWVELDVKTSGENIVLSFMDSGEGIPSEVREKMFTPFYTTKEIGKGTGIGLSISKSMIEKQQGKFLYDDQSPHTRFIIELPIKAA